jgi:tRNA (cytosine38-C5)-methyltransferase
MPPLRALEFYAGTGGMRYALALSGLADAHVVAAFEISPNAVALYNYNTAHGDEPIAARGIETLKPKELDAFDADMWLMSPPCQPYTVSRR